MIQGLQSARLRAWHTVGPQEMAAAVMRIWPPGTPGEGGAVSRAALPPGPLQSPHRSAARLRTVPPALLLFFSTFGGVTPFLPDLTCSVNLGKTPAPCPATRP